MGLVLSDEQKRLRIRLLLAAYAYEFLSDPIMTDAEFDSLCLKVRKGYCTGNSKLDKFFNEEFNPHTGQWIHKFPELHKLKKRYKSLYGS